MSIVCHLTETTTTTMKLKVAAPPPPLPEFGNWDFLQTTPNKQSQSLEKIWAPQKSSFFKLSPISLDLCTENLGSETGSDTITDDDTIFSSYNDKKVQPEAEPESKISLKPIKKTRFHDSRGEISNNFPPPLTSMSGSSNLQVRRHREGGRLIIEAVEAPCRNSYLKAERSEGRLRLCFMTTADGSHIGEEDDDDDENECGEIEECSGNFSSGQSLLKPIESEELNGEVIVTNNNNNNNSEIGIEKFHQLMRRCKEGGHRNNKGLMCNNNWKPAALWVATS